MMSRSYAIGKQSIAVCDRCGGREKYLDLQFQVVNSVKTGLFVCPDCLDQDHPQLKLNRVRIDDPQALRNARPESDLDQSRELIPPLFDPNFNVR